MFFDKEKCLRKIEALTSDHASRGWRLLLFPELFVPGYPNGFTFGATTGDRTQEGRELYLEYHWQRIPLGVSHLKRIERLAKFGLDVAGHYARSDIFDFRDEAQPDTVIEKR